MPLTTVKVRLYPTIKQKELLDRHFDAYRFCYNLCLEYKSFMWKHYKIAKTGYDMQSELFKIRKETDWLRKCKAECLRDAALNVDKSFKKFFNGTGYPKFKTRKREQSFFAYQSIYCKNSRVYFYGSRIRYRTSRVYSANLESEKIKQVVFKRDLGGDYWACVLIDVERISKYPKNENAIGIDLGIKSLAVTSEGDIIDNNKYLISSHFKLRKLQRKFAKTSDGGQNREKLRKRVAKVYRKAIRQKEFYYHQVTNKLIRENQTIVVEKLMIVNMMKNTSLARNISDVSWSMFGNILKRKAIYHDREIITISQWFPSSKTCSSCGNIKDKLLLKDRVYQCECCGLSIDRDLNAAINIRNAGLKIPGVPVEDTSNSSAYEAGSNLLTNN